MIFNISQVLNKNVYAQQLRFHQFYDRVIALLTRQKSTHEYYYEKKKICCDLYKDHLFKPYTTQLFTANWFSCGFDSPLQLARKGEEDETSFRSKRTMSIELRCAKCGWKTEYPDGTYVFELPTTCPTCNVSTQAFAIAHWMRDMHPDL